MPSELCEEKKKFEEIKQKFDEQLDTTDMIEIESEKSAQ